MIDALTWTKTHQKEIVNKIVSDANLESSEKPVAIFMAGLPGAGKTELTYGIMEQFGRSFIRIDMDELATMIKGYKPEIADEFRRPATRLLDNLFSKTIKEKLDFIMDGTFGSSKATQNIERVVKRGYNVNVVYVYQDPKRAWEFTLAREKIEHRSISKEGFLESYYKTINNLHKAAMQFDGRITIHIMEKDKNNKVKGQWVDVSEDRIDKIINIIYNKDELRKYIES